MTEIVADKIELCGNKTERQTSEPVASPTSRNAVRKQEAPLIDDIGDLPPDDGMPF